MYKIEIKKSNNHFFVSWKLTDEFRDLLKDIKDKKYNPKNGGWKLPIEEFDEYIEKLNEIADKTCININDDSSDDESESEMKRKSRTNDSENESSEDEMENCSKKKKVVDQRVIYLNIKKNKIQINFNYSTDIIKAIKTLKGYKFNDETCIWTVPLDQKDQLYKKMKEIKVTIKDKSE